MVGPGGFLLAAAESAMDAMHDQWEPSLLRKVSRNQAVPSVTFVHHHEPPDAIYAVRKPADRRPKIPIFASCATVRSIV